MVDALVGFLETLRDSPYALRLLVVFCVSLLPGIGGPATTIPIGYFVLGLHIPVVTVICIMGNLIPVPFIVLFIRVIFDWMRKISKLFGRIADKFEEKASSKGQRLQKGVFVGLMLYVAIPIPLPGMGAWTAALIAGIFNIKLKTAYPAIALGVLIASTITILGMLGVIAMM